MGKFNLRAVATVAAFALIGTTLLAPPAHAEAAAPGVAADQGTLTSTVTGSFTDAAGAPGTVTGTFEPDRFEVVGDKVMAVGELTATLTDSTGTVVGNETTTVSLPLVTDATNGAVTAQQIVCDVLDLVLGPLDLNLLGLDVHLDRVVLNIVAVPGALLGDLLCAVANLLNGGLGGLLGQLTALLNQILDILRP